MGPNKAVQTFRCTCFLFISVCIACIYKEKMCDIDIEEFYDDSAINDTFDALEILHARSKEKKMDINSSDGEFLYL